MNELRRALDLISEQRRKLPEYSPAAMVGYQLMEILKAQPSAAGVVLADLEGKGMGLADCEQKIKAWADDHKNGQSSVCVPPDEAEKIIRKFYGIEKTASAPARRGTLNLADFL